jgi:hypothetical protein
MSLRFSRPRRCADDPASLDVRGLILRESSNSAGGTRIVPAPASAGVRRARAGTAMSRIVRTHPSQGFDVGGRSRTCPSQASRLSPPAGGDPTLWAEEAQRTRYTIRTVPPCANSSGLRQVEFALGTDDVHASRASDAKLALSFWESNSGSHRRDTFERRPTQQSQGAQRRRSHFAATQEHGSVRSAPSRRSDSFEAAAGTSGPPRSLIELLGSHSRRLVRNERARFVGCRDVRGGVLLAL